LCRRQWAAELPDEPEQRLRAFAVLLNLRCIGVWHQPRLGYRALLAGLEHEAPEPDELSSRRRPRMGDDRPMTMKRHQVEKPGPEPREPLPHRAGRDTRSLRRRRDRCAPRDLFDRAEYELDAVGLSRQRFDREYALHLSARPATGDPNRDMPI
jgi:hypothetical protein